MMPIMATTMRSSGSENPLLLRFITFAPSEIDYRHTDVLNSDKARFYRSTLPLSTVSTITSLSNRSSTLISDRIMYILTEKQVANGCLFEVCRLCGTAVDYLRLTFFVWTYIFCR